MKTRCKWCNSDPLYIQYHDYQWGVAVHNDNLLFEYLTLEGAQAGLNWLTILKKRDSYREAFDFFDFYKISKYNNDKLAQLIANPSIVRNKLKIKSVITNAISAVEIVEEFGSLDNYFWNFVDGKPIKNAFKSIEEVPSSTELSLKMSKDLKKRGFKFVGATICYSFMQAVGIVNDHTADCFRFEQ